jgi:uncharacterized protein
MERVQAVLVHPDFETYLKFNEEQEVHREFCRHHLQHALDVARIYYILYLEEGRDGALPEFRGLCMGQAKEIIYAAALLHDIGRWRQYLDQSLDHGLEGALLAKPILQDAGFKSGEIDIALEAIRSHRNPHAQGAGKLLYRADKLSRNCQKCAARAKCSKLAKMETRDSILY